MVKLAGMMRPHVAVLDDELRDANEACQEGYKKQALQEAAQVLRADHQVYRQQPDEKQDKFSERQTIPLWGSPPRKSKPLKIRKRARGEA